MRIAGGILLLLVILVGVVLLILHGAKSSTQSETRSIVKEYNRELAKAARASRKGHVGEANVYAEGAEHLIELLKGKLNE